MSLATLQLNRDELTVLLRALALASTMPPPTTDLDDDELSAVVWRSPHASPVAKSLATALAEAIIEVER